jgi:F-type H+-transporting ATPase subunit b
MIEPATTGILGSLGINGKMFLAQLVNFSIVVIVMWKWVYTPLLSVMDKRTKEIADGLANARQADQRLKDAAVEKERLIREAKGESHSILEETRDKAEAIRKTKLEETKREIEKIADEAKSQISAERKASYDALQRDVASLVTAATAKVVSGFDESAHRDLIAKAIKDVSAA